MNERVKELRKALGLTLDKFGERLGVTKQTVSRIENGINNVTDQMFKSICREFNVNENWLRTSEGEMFVQRTREETVTNIVKNALASDDNFIINTFTALGQLTPAEWDLVKKFINTISGDKPPAASEASPQDTAAPSPSSTGSDSGSSSGTAPVTLRAAHMNPGATKEQIAADDAMMKSDDF